MNEQRAREILGDRIEDDDGLWSDYQYMEWKPKDGSDDIGLEGTFTPDELEAIVWWMRNKCVK
jgi:hypothetical protein